MTEKYISKQETQTVDTIYNRCVSKKININPTYQRDSVWSVEQQSEFLESIHIGIIPNNVLFNIDDDGNYICVDGKQRIESIREFKENKIPLIQYNEQGEPISHIYYNSIPKAEPEKKSVKQKKAAKVVIENKLLDKKEKLAFDNTPIPVTTYTNLSYHDQIDIFNRIQKGSRLTQGETVTSSIPDEECAKEFNELCNKHIDLFKKFNKIKTERRGHYNVIANLMYMVHVKKFELPSKKKREAFFGTEEVKETFGEIKELTEKTLAAAFNKQMLGNDKVSNDTALNIIYSACFYTYDTFIKGKHKLNTVTADKFVGAVSQLNDDIKKKNNTCKTFDDYRSHFQKLMDTNSKSTKKVIEEKDDEEEVSGNEDDNNDDNQDDGKEDIDDGDKSVDAPDDEIESEQDQEPEPEPVPEPKKKTPIKGAKKTTTTKSTSKSKTKK